MENSTKIDDIEKGVRSIQPEKAKPDKSKTGVLSFDISLAVTEPVALWISLSYLIVVIHDIIEQGPNLFSTLSSHHAGASFWYVYYLPILSYGNFLTVSSFLANWAIFFKTGRKTAAILALVAGYACIGMLGAAIFELVVSTRPHIYQLGQSELCMDEYDALIDELVSYRGSVLFKLFIQFTFLAYVTAFGLPDLIELEKK